MTRPSPFRFDEFRAAAPDAAAPPPARVWSADEVAAARAEGVVEGRRLAMETIAADEAASLVRIGAALAEQHAAVGQEALRAKAEVLGVARVFLEEFCAGLVAEREVEIAADLLRSLTEHSEDRRAARLFISAKSLERLRGRMEDMIGDRALGDFVSLDGDPALKPGEARIEWRGGQARRGRAEIASAIAAVFDSLSSEPTSSEATGRQS